MQRLSTSPVKPGYMLVLFIVQQVFTAQSHRNKKEYKPGYNLQGTYSFTNQTHKHMKAKQCKTLWSYILRYAAQKKEDQTKGQASVLVVGFELSLRASKATGLQTENKRQKCVRPAVLKVHPKTPSFQGQKYFISLMLFPFFTFIHSQLHNAGFQRLHAMWYHNRLGTEAGMRIQLFSIKPHIKEICKNVKQCHLLCLCYFLKNSLL